MIPRIELTDEDKRKINRCQLYKQHKTIMASTLAYADYEVGTAVFIKSLSTSKLISTNDWSSKSIPIKYIIVENDFGFVFAKRILANGGVSKNIICITTDYSSKNWELVTDEELLDAMLLDEHYDPTAKAKETQKKKGKASRLNSKHRIMFDTPSEAYNYLESLKVGDKFWSVDTSYGSGICEYQIDEIVRSIPNITCMSTYYGWRRRADLHKSHIDEGFGDIIQIKSKSIDGTTSLYDKVIAFYNICRYETYKYDSKMLYSKKPVNYEDL